MKNIFLFRSRSEISVTTMEDSMTSSHVGSQSGSESGLLGSVTSLNDHDTPAPILENEEDDEDYTDFVPIPGKIVS